MEIRQARPMTARTLEKIEREIAKLGSQKRNVWNH